MKTHGKVTQQEITGFFPYSRRKKTEFFHSPFFQVFPHSFSSGPYGKTCLRRSPQCNLLTQFEQEKTKMIHLYSNVSTKSICKVNKSIFFLLQKVLSFILCVLLLLIAVNQTWAVSANLVMYLRQGKKGLFVYLIQTLNNSQTVQDTS